ncbi:MAG: DUF2271 domain-containing protein [Acidimicrobiales bacterium]
MEPPELPRFDAATRRAFLKRAAALGALVAVPGALGACGTSGDDADTFADATTTTAPAGGAGSTTTAAGTTDDAGSGDALPDGAQLEVAFTYAASGDGRGPARNPFIAVWVEDAAGELVATLSVWYNPPKGERWIHELSGWSSAASGTDVDAVTGATRPAGSYTVAWDGTDLAGARAAPGTYTVWIEAAREHGPHSITSASIDLGTSGAEAAMPDADELSAASATYSA